MQVPHVRRVVSCRSCRVGRVVSVVSCRVGHVVSCRFGRVVSCGKMQEEKSAHCLNSRILTFSRFFDVSMTISIDLDAKPYLRY